MTAKSLCPPATPTPPDRPSLEPGNASSPRFRKASQVIADALRHEISAGVIADGDLLPPEGDLIERFGVSRPTLREAIRILETEGLLTTTRGGNKGHRIHHPTAYQAARQASLALRLRGATIMDVFVLASILVPPAVRMVAEMKPQPDLGELHRLYELMVEHRDHPQELARLIRRFDVAVCALCGNAAISFVSQMMAEIIELQIGEIPSDLAGLPPENIAEMGPARKRFGDMLAALTAGDGEKAEELMQQRLRDMIRSHTRLVTRNAPIQLIE
ncbi:GntR family transcriptional regulator [Sphingobium sp. Sx8-8]|uniref:FadR/GntR family transcriptional regulator n=1 Tax=Sphingobium sp. Sx8-8 TaxID=2933617 RepID=UPI001F5AE663|nr:GntR family transcriptional regulator [Sphingobium sp. Sx8-8]